MADWYRDAFGPDYLDLYCHRDRNDALEAIAFLESQDDLWPRAGRQVLDLCCGNGRHSIELLRQARPFVAGFDLSDDLLRNAQAATAGHRVALPLVRGDMRSLPFASGTFDLILNLFTSFGYFPDDRDNACAMSEAARVLRRGGRMVLDHINPAALRRTLKPESHRTTPSGARVTERRRIDEPRRRVEKEILLEREGERRSYLESVRFFEPDEMAHIIQSAGLRLLRSHGGFDASPLTPVSQRAIYVLGRD